MAKASFRVQVVGLKELQRKVRGNELFRDPYRDGLEQAAAHAENTIRASAPKGATGQLGARLTHRLAKSDIPRWAVVKTTAVAKRPADAKAFERTASGKRQRRTYTSKRGHSWTYPYSYPRRLEFDRRSPHKDWMLRGLQRARGGVQQILSVMARAIERKWGR